MMGGSGNDTFRLWSDGPGTNNTNYISGGGGNDTLDYSLAPGPVNVNMQTGTTSNYYGGIDDFSGIESVVGSAYNDTFTVGPSGGVSLFGEGGNNTFFMSGGTNTINGGTGTNTLNYSFATGAVTVNLATGITSYATGGTDTFSAIADVIGSAYNDLLTAGATGNVLNGGAGNNTMTGGAGNDMFELWSDGPGTGYNNYINGGGGTNTLDYTQSPGLVNVNLATGNTSNYYGGTDYFSNIQDVFGSAYNDTLTAGSTGAIFNGEGGSNTMMGGAGNDTFELWSDAPGTGNSNYINGGGGTNTLDYSQSPGPVNANLMTGHTSNYYGGTDFFSNIQDVVGSAFNDLLVANGTGTVLTGEAATIRSNLSRATPTAPRRPTLCRAPTKYCSVASVLLEQPLSRTIRPPGPSILRTGATTKTLRSPTRRPSIPPTIASPDLQRLTPCRPALGRVAALETERDR